MANVTSGYNTSTGMLQQGCASNIQPAFDSAIAWREYAGYLETKLQRHGFAIEHIANDVLRTTPPRKTTGDIINPEPQAPQ